MLVVLIYKLTNNLREFDCIFLNTLPVIYFA